MGFLDQLLLFADPALPVEVLMKMNSVYGFGNSANTEIQYRWYGTPCSRMQLSKYR